MSAGFSHTRVKIFSLKNNFGFLTIRSKNIVGCVSRCRLIIISSLFLWIVYHTLDTRIWVCLYKRMHAILLLKPLFCEWCRLYWGLLTLEYRFELLFLIIKCNVINLLESLLDHVLCFVHSWDYTIFKFWGLKCWFYLFLNGSWRWDEVDGIIFFKMSWRNLRLTF